MEELKKHIIDTVKEWQMKLGYQEENICLYYPADSLKGMLGLPIEAAERDLQESLEAFCRSCGKELGEIAILKEEERYGIDVPKEGCKYIAKHVPDNELLKGLLCILASREKSMQKIRELFSAYAAARGGKLIEEPESWHGHGTVFFFDRDEIDPYVYCMEEDEFGITYHRFSRRDYERLKEE